MADDNQVTIIGLGAKFKGEMTFEHSAKILGGFEGKIIAQGEVTIGETAACKASIEAARVLVDGPIDGDIVARQRIELTNKARVKGDIVAGTLTVAEGAAFIGHCRVGPDAIRPDGTIVEVETKATNVRRSSSYAGLGTTPVAAATTTDADNGSAWLSSSKL